AASIATAFFSFLPTAYRGLSELGLIAGIGIVIALATTLTLLPALLTVLQPPPEQKPIGFAALGCLDRFLENRRNWVVGTTLAVAILGLPLLAGLRFDFNPLNLRAQDAESVVTLLDLMKVPDTSPNTIDVLKSDLAQASATAEKLRQLPEVGRVLTLESFVAKEQDAKLTLIEPLRTTLRQARHLLDAERVSIETLPPELKKAWMSTDGRFRIEVMPKGDGNDNAVLRRFVTAVHSVAPEAVGTPVFMIEAATTVVKAFLQAGILSLLL